MIRLRALTVQQPFAWAIAYAGKTVENRPRRMAWTGTLAIHAGLALHTGHFPTSTPEGRAAAQALDALGGRGNCWNPRHLAVPGLTSNPHPGLALGAIIAVAEVTGCHWHEDCSQPGTGRLCTAWAMPGQHHIQLARIRPLRQPIPCRGNRGLWPLPGEMELQLHEQATVDDGWEAAQ